MAAVSESCQLMGSVVVPVQHKLFLKKKEDEGFFFSIIVF